MRLIFAQVTFLFYSISQTAAQTEILPKDTGADICRTSGCNETANLILKNMDRNVDPCDDFYQFSCGNFLENSTYKISMYKVLLELKVVLEEESKADDIKPFQLVKTLYKACIDKSLIEEQGLTPQLLDRTLKDLGGWPVLMGNKWNESDFDWKESVYRFRKMGHSIDYFIKFEIDSDPKNSTRYIIQFEQPPLGLSRNELLEGIESDSVKEYYARMVDIAEVLGANGNQTKELEESLEFEMKLANITVSHESRSGNMSSQFNEMTVRELHRNFPTIPWLEYINTLLKPSRSITEDEVVNVFVPSFITKLEKLLEQTPKRDQANYVMWRAANSILDLFGNEINRNISSSTKPKPASMKCVRSVTSNLPIAVTSLYARKHLNETIKKTAMEMISNIKQGFEIMLRTEVWMDDETTLAALGKAESMVLAVGYPDEYFDDQKLEELYRNLELTRGNYLQNMLNVSIFVTESLIEKLTKPVNTSDWVNWSKKMNLYEPFNSLAEISTYLPAGLLQSIYFSIDRPMYLNYGLIGSRIGRMMTFNFDRYGQEVDKNGNYNNWWANGTMQKYIEQIECMIYQYGNYTASEDKQRLNGTDYTYLDDITNNGGMKAAYLAYNEWVQRNKPELEKLPGLHEYSPQQMFWISVANKECSIRISNTTYEDDPNALRVLVPLSNMAEFAEDFKCPVGSKMNPERKCPLW